MKIRVIFEKEKTRDALECGWGLAYLIGDVLFDTAEKPEFLLNNLREMGIDIRGIKHVVISHNNWDHRAGLWDLLKLNPNIMLHACSDFMQEFKDRLSGSQCATVDTCCEISPNIFSTGCVKARYRNESLLEQVLVIKTGNGLSIVCGCAHPGVLSLIDTVMRQFTNIPLYSVLGGFHLMETDTRVINFIATEMKRLGVKKVAPGHCCGFEAISIFKEVFGSDCIEIKAGMEFEI